MSKKVILVNAILAGVAVFCAGSLVRDLTHARSLPPPPAPRRAVAVKAGEGPSGPDPRAEALGAFSVIAAKHLFNPARTEGGAAPSAPAAPPAPKPMLMGVVVDGPQSRAYLEDPSSKRVVSYQVGDTVSGGHLTEITGEMVRIVRPDGPIEVMLRDPSKPKPATPAGAVATPPVGAGPRVDTSSVPARGQIPPPPRLLRRPPVNQPQGPQD